MGLRKGQMKKLDAQTIKKIRQTKVDGIEFSTGGDLHGPQKPGWSAGGMDSPESSSGIQFLLREFCYKVNF